MLLPTIAKSLSRVAVPLAVASIFSAPDPARAQSVEFDAARSTCVERDRMGVSVFLRSLVAFDTNEDGHLDLAVTLAPEHVTRLYLGDGDGNFSPGGDLDGGGEDLEATDLDGDGHVDIVAAAGGVLSVHLGAGDGTFGPKNSISLGFGRAPRDLVLRDFDRDGRLDAAVACNFSHTVAVLLGDGAGGFSLVGNFAVEGEAYTISAADFDEDGNEDFVAARVFDDALQFRLGDGTGLFPGRMTLPVADHPSDVVATDLDGDGHADLAVPSRSGDFVRLLFGDGSGNFPSSRDLGVALPDTVFFDDLDRDGALDLVVASVGSLSIRMGDGAGGFGPERAFGTANDPVSASFGDFDEDGRGDIVTANETVDSVSLLLGDGAGRFPSARRFSGVFAAEIDIGDFDGDGHVDVAATGGSAGRLNAFFGSGDGTLGTPTILQMSGETGDVSAFDFDLDGLADLVGSFADASGAPQGIAAFASDGAGGFVARGVTEAGRLPGGMAPADFDADGIPDIAVVGEASDDVTVLLGAGNGSFPARFVASTNDQPNAVVARDFDEDGIVDLAVSHGSSSASTIRVFQGDGSGAMTSALVLTRPRRVLSLGAADVDEDGHLDLLAGEFEDAPPLFASGVAVFPGDGAGGFEEPNFFGAGCQPSSVVAADVNDDAHLDLIVTNAGSADVSVSTGDGLGTFALARSFSVYDAREARVADFDEDGHPDLVVGSRLSSGGVHILRNRTFDPAEAFAGNVNAAAGPIANVLFVNGQRGTGPDRRLEVERNAPFVLRMKAPPAVSIAAFALYAWIGESRNWTVTALPNGYGKSVIPSPLGGGRPKRIWNNTGDPSFGTPRLPSTHAPSVVLRRENGVKKRLTFTLQGIIEDPAGPSGVYATTNAITVDSR